MGFKGFWYKSKGHVTWWFIVHILYISMGRGRNMFLQSLPAEALSSYSVPESLAVSLSVVQDGQFYFPVSLHSLWWSKIEMVETSSSFSSLVFFFFFLCYTTATFPLQLIWDLGSLHFSFFLSFLKAPSSAPPGIVSHHNRS